MILLKTLYSSRVLMISPHSTENTPQFWSPSTVQNILQSSLHPLHYWTSSIVLMVLFLHSTEYAPKCWTSFKVVHIPHSNVLIPRSTEHPPEDWTPSTVLSIFHSTDDITYHLTVPNILHSIAQMFHIVINLIPYPSSVYFSACDSSIYSKRERVLSNIENGTK